MSELAKKHGHKDSGEMKRLLILFTVDVRARLNEVLNVTWHDFQINEHDVHVYMVGKGRKKIRQTISKTLYEQLLGIRIDGEDRVFNIHRNTVNRLMNYLREKMNFPPQRKIVFHSFKKAGVDFVYNNTKDILLTSIAANHSDVGVTDRYINKEKDIGIVGVFSSQNGIDKKLYKKITHEDLLKAIDALPLDQQMYINLKIREISN